MKTSLPLCLCAAALALAGCEQTESNTAAPAAQGNESAEAGDAQTIAAALDQNSRFFQAAKAVGLDSTLAGPGPYTVLVPSDEAFAKLEGGPLNDIASPQNRAEITRILTYHILPGVILAEDISKAIENGQGKTLLATMGGETLSAAKEDGNIVLTDASGTKAVIGQADQRASNGAIHRIDAVMMPPAPGQGSGNEGQDN